MLSRAHSTPVSDRESRRLHFSGRLLTVMIVPEVLKAAEEPIKNVVDTVSKLSQAASKMPYYKFNNMWSRQMQGAVRFHPHHHKSQITDRSAG